MSKKVLFVSDSLGLSIENHRGISNYSFGMIDMLKGFGFDVTLLVERQRAFGMLGRFSLKYSPFKNIISSSNVSEVYRYFVEARYQFTWELRKNRKILGFERKRKQFQIENPPGTQDLYPKRGKHLKLFDSFLWCDYVYSDAPAYCKHNKGPVEIDASGFDYVFFDAPHFIKVKNINKSNVFQVIHDVIPVTDPNWSWDWREMFLKKIRMALFNSENFLFVSEFTKRAFLDTFPKVESKFKSEIIYPSISDEHLDIAEGNGLSSKEKSQKEFQILGERQVWFAEADKNLPYAVTILTDEERKNIPLILSISQKFLGKMNFVVIGKIAKKKYIGKKANLFKNVIFTGFVTEEEKKSLLSEASLFVFPSLSEGFGIPLLEASLNNLPIVASDLDIFKEIGGENIKYFDPYDPDDCAESIDEVLGNREAWVEKSCCLRKTIRSRFSTKVVARKMYEFMHNVHQG